MRLFTELRSWARHVVGPFLGICAVVYFAFHAIQGDRGLIAWLRLEQEVQVLRSTLAEVSGLRAEVEHRVKLLHPSSLDPDMLDERARLMLNFGYPGELVIFVDRRER